jgi:hypothetical protein
MLQENALRLDGYLELPSREFLQRNGGPLPHEWAPSDHLPLIAQFHFT